MIRPLALAAAAALASTSALGQGLWGQNCKHTADREASIDAAEAETIEVLARAGQLRITGTASGTEVVARGRACSNKKDLLDEIEIGARRLADRVQISADMPDIADRDSRWYNELAVLDLEIEVPAGANLIVYDSSGDTRITGVGSLEITDSSGDLDLRDIAGPVTVPKDSSGDLEIRRAGPVTINIDSSGDIYIEEVASVTIATDTSGDIDLVDVEGDVMVGSDTSGHIDVRGVGGSFVVQSDTSGGIQYRRVAGNVSVPDYVDVDPPRQ